jgi:mannosyltransferase OCH1-like enzyme
MNKLFHIFFGLSNDSNKINIGIVKNYHKFLSHNDDFSLIKWNKHKCVEIIKEFFPEYMQIYNMTHDYRYKCDLVRLIVLYVHGGLYMDIDAECLTNVNQMGLNDKTNLSVVFNDNETEIFNSFIYVKYKHNPFIEECIHKYAKLLHTVFIGACPLMKEVFDTLYSKENYKNEGIIIHYEKPEKRKEKCVSNEEFWKSFYIFTENGEKILKSRYDDYYSDKKKHSDVDFM